MKYSVAISLLVVFSFAKVVKALPAKRGVTGKQLATVLLALFSSRLDAQVLNFALTLGAVHIS
jgi:hypothetical protein